MTEPTRTSHDPAEEGGWRVRLFQGDNGRAQPLGAGVLLPGGLVLTCAHVVLHTPDDGRGAGPHVQAGPDPGQDGGQRRSADRVPLDRVFAEFPGARAATVAGRSGVARGAVRPVRAKVMREYLRPLTTYFSGDIALLELAEIPDVPPAKLHRQIPARNEQVHTVGYPPDLWGGEDIDAVLKGRGGPGPEWVQLDPVRSPYAIRPGFSGSGVVHSRSRRVIGIVVDRYGTEEHQVPVGHAYMIPTESILKHLPPERLGLTATGTRAVSRGIAVAPRRTDTSRAPGLRRKVTRWLEEGAAAGVAEAEAGGTAGADPVEVIFARDGEHDALHAIHSTLTLADREQNPRAVSRGDADEPGAGTIDIAVDATGRTAAQLVTRTADRIGLDSPDAPGSAADAAHIGSLLDRIAEEGPPLSAAFLSVDRTIPSGEDAMPLLRALRGRGLSRLLLVFRDQRSPLLAKVVAELLNPHWAERRATAIAARLAELTDTEERLRQLRKNPPGRGGNSFGSRAPEVPPEPRGRQLRAELDALRASGALQGPPASGPSGAVGSSDAPAPADSLPYDLFRLDIAVEDALLRAVAAVQRFNRPERPSRFTVDPPGDELTDLPVITVSDPDALVEPEPEPPDGHPGDEGAGLRPGDELHRQYKVVGRLGQGSYGQVYLARDLLLVKRPVALKGVRDRDDPAALRLAEQERLRLVSLNHPSVIRVINYARHPDHPANKAEFIVMEFADGASLEWVAERIARSVPPFAGFRVHEFIVAYGLLILNALTYLHEVENLVYGDLSLTNVIHCGKGIKLIDVAGVRRIGSSGPVTYRPPELDASTAMTIAGDLYGVGAVLKELLSHVPAHPSDLGTKSLERALLRATADRPEERFADAAEMSVQLRGVLRELRSLRLGEETFEPSPLFSPAAAALDGELGKAPALTQWLTGGARKRPLVVRPPKPAEVAVGLPVPKPDRKDLNWKELQRTSYDDPAGLLQLSDEWSRSPELALLRCRLHLDTARDQGPDSGAHMAWAVRDLEQARREIGPLAAHDWRVHWHEGLLHLAANRVEPALDSFDRVYAAIPGEFAPKLALGYCHEWLGHGRQAMEFYEAVWHRNHALGSAAFGLARIHLDRDNPARALDSLEAVPADSRHRTAARTAMVRIHADLPKDGAAPTVAAARQAYQALHRLDRHDGLTDGQAKERLTTDLRELLLTLVVSAAGSGQPDPLESLRAELPDEIDVPLSERELRNELYKSYLLLCEQVPKTGRDEHKALAKALVDNAYSTRPTSRRHGRRRRHNREGDGS